jgi:hypothetical protein
MKMVDKLANLFIDIGSVLRDAITAINHNERGIALVVDDRRRLIGTITDPQGHPGGQRPENAGNRIISAAPYLPVPRTGHRPNRHGERRIDALDEGTPRPATAHP